MTGFLAGLAAGVAIGLLYAPRNGKETRDRLRSQGNDLADAAQQHAERIKNLAATVQEQFGTIVSTSAPGADASSEGHA